MSLKLFMIFVFLLNYFGSFSVDAIVECSVEPKNNEGRIRKAILCNYDKTTRPIIGDGAITVKLRLIAKGFSFDDTDNRLTISSWLSMTWNDDHLKWNPSDYGGVKSITQNSEDIWQPDLALYNSDIAAYQDDSCKKATCVINSTGSIQCIPPCSHDAECDANYKRWPYDKQNCTLHVGTWVNSGEEVDLQINPTRFPDGTLESQNKEWKMIKSAYRRNHGNYSQTKDTYPSVTYSFLFQRHGTQHTAVIVIPAITLVLLNLLSLWIDTENNARIGLLALSLYGHFSYIQQISWYVPSNGDSLPDIILYFRDSLFITAILICNTVIVRGLNSCAVQVPNWLESTTSFASTNKVGQLLLTKHIIERERLNGDVLIDDEINLVESQTDDENKTQTIPNKSKLWKTFGLILDRGLFFIIGIFYLCGTIGLIPEQYSDELKQVEVFSN